MTEPGRRHALIVAVSEYQDPKLRQLRAPAADAEQLAEVLRDPAIGGFEVDMAIDEDEPQLSRRLARFFSDRKPDDLLLLHFSCHGVKDDAGDLHLATTDTEMGDLLGVTSLASSWLSAQMGRCRSKRIVMLLDCCFSGSFPFGARARASGDVNMEAHFEGRGRAVITASSSMEYAYEGEQLSGKGEPSIFTEAVVEALRSGKADRDGDRAISVDELYDYVFDRVRERTPSQRPQMMSSLEGPLYIARSSYEAPVEPAELDGALLALVESPLAGARLGAVTELARLLTVRDRAVVAAAREQLELLTDDDSQQVCAAARTALDDRRAAAAPAPVLAAPPPYAAQAAPPAEAEPPPVIAKPPPPRRTPALVRWRNRSAAAAIDAMPVFLLGVFPAWVMWLPESNQDPIPDGVAYGASVTAFIVGGLIYAVLFRSSREGRSVGKRAYAFAVRSLDGTVPRKRTLLLREGVKWTLIGFSLGLAAIPIWLLARLRDDRRGLHELASQTTVVQLDPAEAGQSR